MLTAKERPVFVVVNGLAPSEDFNPRTDFEIPPLKSVPFRAIAIIAEDTGKRDLNATDFEYAEKIGGMVVRALERRNPPEGQTHYEFIEFLRTDDFQAAKARIA
jgi:hypothetical protein